MQKVQAHDDEASGSGYSDLSAMENDTDTLGRAIIQHERDARRMQAVLNGSNRPFSRATPRIPPSQRLQRAPRTSTGQEREGTEQPHVVTEVEPQPRARKSKFDRDFTRRPRVSPPKQEALPKQELKKHELAADQDAIVPHTTVYTGGHDWQVGSMRGVEDTPPSMRRHRLAAEQASLLHMKSSFGDSRDILNDFSSEAVLESTPVLDRERRLNLSPRDKIMTSRIPRLDLQRNTAPIPIHEDAEEFTNASDKENIPQNVVTREDMNQNGHEVQHSVDSRDRRRTSLQELLLRSSRLQRPFNEEEVGASYQDIGTPVVTGGWVDSPKPVRDEPPPVKTNTPALATLKRNENDPSLEEQHQAPTISIPRQPLKELKEVTENAVKPLQHQYEQQVSKLKDEDVKRGDPRVGAPKVEKPDHTSSADTKQTTYKQSKQVAEHIAEAMAGPTTAVRDRSQAKPDPTTSADIKQTAQKQSKPIAEYIADAVSGLATAVKKPPLKPVKTNIKRIEPHTHTSVTAKDVHTNSHSVCPHCGNIYISHWKALWEEARSNFWFYDVETGSLQLTRLGKCSLAFISWYLVELVLCEIYSQPLYAVTMRGYGVDPYAPRFPFVTVILLLRPFEVFWGPTQRRLDDFGTWLFIWIFGVAASQGATGYCVEAILPRATSLARAKGKSVPNLSRTQYSGDWSRAATTAASAASMRVVRSAVDAIDDLGRMWDDA